MNYFLPSWYRAADSWDSWDQIWYQQHQESDFDDTVNQVRMFYQTGQPTTLLVPAYFPGLRHFLHRQRILEVPVVNVFDRLQGIASDYPMHRLALADLPWSATADLVYGSSTLAVFQAGTLTHRVYQGTEGQLVAIEQIQDNQPVRWLRFDDRGFLSRVEDRLAEGWQQTYLDPAGHRRMMVTPDGRVTRFNPAGELVQIAGSLTDLVVAAVHDYFQATTEPKIYLAADQGHSAHLAPAIRTQKYALSYFYHRGQPSQDAAAQSLQAAQFLLADSDHNQAALQQAGGTKIIELPPFDTRLRLGTSNQEAQLKLWLQVDGLSPERLQTALTEILALMDGNQQLELLVASYTGDDRQRVLAALTAITARGHYRYAYQLKSLQEAEAQRAENPGLDTLDDEQPQRVIAFETLDSELKILTLLQPIRLLVDLTPVPDVYLQIAAISAGIPQINQVPSMYVDDHQNGLVIQNQPGALTQALQYYLVGLKHWNAALVYTTQKIGTYTGPKLVAQLQAAMKGD